VLAAVRYRFVIGFSFELWILDLEYTLRCRNERCDEPEDRPT
jgi:hypothetical protein